MPCIGIVGVKIRVDKLPEILKKTIFGPDLLDINSLRYTWRHLQLSENYFNVTNKKGNLNLNIYSIEYNDVKLDFYIHSYRNNVDDDIYIVYSAMNSDKKHYYDNYFDYNDLTKFSEWLKFLKENVDIDIKYENSGFFIVEI